MLTLSILYIVLLVVGFVFTGVRKGSEGIYDGLLWFVLFVILGFAVFGIPK